MIVNFPSFYLPFFKINMVGPSIIAKSTYFKELLFPFFKIFYTLIVHYVINFVFSMGKQPYKEVIYFVSYKHVLTRCQYMYILILSFHMT